MAAHLLKAKSKGKLSVQAREVTLRASASEHQCLQSSIQSNDLCHLPLHAGIDKEGIKATLDLIGAHGKRLRFRLGSDIHDGIIE
jgi:hypothetical protein